MLSKVGRQPRNPSKSKSVYHLQLEWSL